MNDLQALVALTLIPHLGAIKIRLLMQRFGSALNALQADPHDLAELPGFGPKIVEGFTSRKWEEPWQKNLELAAKQQATLVSWEDPAYPKKLLEIPDYPVLLYVKGNLSLLKQQGIAIVGTRSPTIYGAEMAEMFGRVLASRGMTVVSGLARGVDTAAHRGALQTGYTIAVIGSGLADIYPRENSALAEAIIAQGVLISEFPMAAPPDRANFPQRNRIVSGMTLGSLLIEAPEKSGAMITMDKAFLQGRRLFAIPGRADSEHFRGNHALIKKGIACLVETPEDLVNSFDQLFGQTGRQSTIATRNSVFELEKDEEELLRNLPSEEISLEAMEQRTKLPIKKLNVLLMSLMLKRAIKEYPGKLYKKNRAN